VALEFLGVNALLAVTSEDRLDRRISALYRLQGSECSLQPVLRQVVQDGMGLISGRHAWNGSRGYGDSCMAHAEASELAGRSQCQTATVTAQARSANETIRTPDQRLRVFVSSTIAELADERRAVSAAISALRLTPVLFELGARPHPPGELYRAYLRQSDVFIGVYWQSYGRVSAGMEISGLEEEYELSQRLPHLLYVKEPAPDREPRLSQLLSRMKAETSYRKFATAEELDRLVRDDLATLLSERFGAGREAGDLMAEEDEAQRRARSLPASPTPLIGRAGAIEEIATLVELADVRLVTLTGPGGVGKTRLAVAVGEQLRGDFAEGTVCVGLADVTEPDLVFTSIGRAIGADLAGSASPLEAVVERLGAGAWLLVLDNLEQAGAVGPELGELLARCPGVKVLATSRAVLRLRAEREYPVVPLPIPSGSADGSIDELSSAPAVALFLDRARAVRNEFELTAENAKAVVAICRRLEGLPLAIELAAARIRVLEPEALLDRLARSLDALETQAVDVPERQRTLRATVEWSVNLLDADERSMLEAMAVFVDGWTMEAASAVTGLAEDQTLDLTEALARHSLINLDLTGEGPRPRMLDTVRAFVRERLDARPDAGDIARLHADYFTSLADRADRHLRGPGQSEWLERLDLEAGNLAAAIHWYLDHDRTELPRMFRALWLFWELLEYLGEARTWMKQVESGAGSLSPHAQGELFWSSVATAVDGGDDEWAIAAAARLRALMPEIDDPFLRAISQIVIGWTDSIEGDLDTALSGVLAALEQLREQEEPCMTAVAAVTAGNLKIALLRYEDALPHLTEACDLADRWNYPWLGALARALLGTLAVLQGRVAEGSQILDEGLALSMSLNARNATQFLVGFSRVALASGKPERAAFLAGAADGLRRRVGLRPWPMQRRDEANLVAQIGEALGPTRRDEALAAGSALNLRQAVAAMQEL
jgi:predicted ATPase